MGLPSLIRSATYLSYSWGRSRSPCYAFKTRKNFDQALRDQITNLFGWMAHAQLSRLAETALVIGVPPRTTIKWGMENHLDDLLCAIEQVNFSVLRNVFEFEGDRLVLADMTAAAVIRDNPVIVVDNLLNSRRTVSKITAKLAEVGATEVHLCIMGRWIEGLPEAIRTAKEFRVSLCADSAQIGECYRRLFGPAKR